MESVGKLKAQPLSFLDALLKDERIRGMDGRDGVDGVDGADGRDGVDGRDGAPGQRGERGLRGLCGERGERGLQGEQGERGERGLAGMDGERGEKGDVGERGLQGKRGPKGIKGDKGNPPKHQIEKRNEGDRIRFERPDGTWGAWVEPRQIVKHEVRGGGGGGGKLLTNAVQDIEALRAGKYPDYSRVTVVTADVTLTDFHRIVVAKTNAVTVTLPPAADYFNSTYSTGIIYTIANDKANTKNVTVAADGAELIDDANTWTVPPGAAPKIVTDGSKWHII